MAILGVALVTDRVLLPKLVEAPLQGKGTRSLNCSEGGI